MYKHVTRRETKRRLSSVEKEGFKVETKELSKSDDKGGPKRKGRRIVPLRKFYDWTPLVSWVNQTNEKESLMTENQNWFDLMSNQFWQSIKT